MFVCCFFFFFKLKFNTYHYMLYMGKNYGICIVGLVFKVEVSTHMRYVHLLFYMECLDGDSDKKSPLGAKEPET